MEFYRSLILYSVCLLSIACANAAGLSRSQAVTFSGKAMHEPYDFSAVARVGKYIVVGSDEGHVIQILKRKNARLFVLERKYSLPDGKETTRKKKQDPELDIEGMAADGRRLYIVGSHSIKRSRVDRKNAGNRSHKTNRKRLRETVTEQPRRALIRLQLGSNGKIDGRIELTSLWNAIKRFPELKPFTQIPSKENGIDIEGIAVSEGKLYIGFRGPVLRENWVPVMVTEFDRVDEKAELRFVNLDGLGIRDIVSVNGQFLILAGPVGDGPGGYHLYSWNGLDCIPGKKGARGKVQHLGKIPVSGGARAEAVTVLSTDKKGSLQLLVVFDGPERGAPQVFRLKK